MDDFGTSFLIFGFCDPHGLEGWQWWQDWTTDPDQEFPFFWGEHLYFHGWWSQSSNFLAESLWDTWEHSCSTTHNDVAVQIFSNINITLKDGLISDFVEAWHFLSNQHRFEEGLWASESLVANWDSLSIGKLINSIVLGSLVVVLNFKQFLLFISCS